MRELRFALAVFGCFLAASLFLAQTGCGGKSSPTAPAGETGFAWAWPEIYSYNGSTSAYLQLRYNGAPVTDALVVLSGSFSGSPVTAAYQEPITQSGHVFADYYVGGFTYTAGQTYVLSSAVSGVTASVTLTAPGGISVSQMGAGGPVTYVDAAFRSNKDYVLIDGDGGTTTTLLESSVTFPVTIAAPPSGAYPGTTGDVYEFDAGAKTQTTSGVANAGLSFGQVLIWEEYDHSVTLP